MLLVCGSAQRRSANRWLLDAWTEITGARADCAFSVDVRDVEPFEPDDVDDAPVGARRFRAEIGGAAGVVIATPEYAASIPGMLKNALDWVVGSGELFEKPVVLLSTGSLGGEHVLPAMAMTLGYQGAHLVGQLGVEWPRAKFDAAGRLVEASTRQDLAGLIDAMLSAARPATP